MFKRKRWWPELSEDPPFDILPVSNGEYIPKAPSRQQLTTMALQNDEIERVRRKLGMDRREFVRSAAAFAVGLWSIDQVAGGRFGRYAWAMGEKSTAACDLEHPGVQLNNLPGEFVFDCQMHHVESGGEWRITNPLAGAYIMAGFSQTSGSFPGIREDGSVKGVGAGELDPIENFSRYHMIKEIFLDSATTMGVLSMIPSPRDSMPLTHPEAGESCGIINRLAGSQRCVMHAFGMPNRGKALVPPGAKPLFMQEEFDLMETRAVLYKGLLVGWKTYPGWGDTAFAYGWWLDDDVGQAYVDHILQLWKRTGALPNIPTHKGFGIPGVLDADKCSPRDIGPAARMFPEARFIVYHSGFDGEFQAPYPGDDKVNAADRSVDAFIKSLREAGLDAGSHVPAGLEHGNAPNVWAELGATWWTLMSDPNQAAHLLGKLVTHVGPERVIYGTDSIIYGSPHNQIVALRALQFTDRAKEIYNLPYGLDGDRFDPRRNALDGSSYLTPHPHVADWPTDGRAHPERSIRNGILGRNAAVVYGIDPDATRHAMSCDDVQKLRDTYVLNEGTPKERVPGRTNIVHGARTPLELFRRLRAGSH